MYASYISPLFFFTPEFILVHEHLYRRLPSWSVIVCVCVQVLPSFVEILRESQLTSVKRSLPCLQFIYWSLLLIEQGTSQQVSRVSVEQGTSQQVSRVSVEQGTSQQVSRVSVEQGTSQQVSQLFIEQGTSRQVSRVSVEQGTSQQVSQSFIEQSTSQ